MRMANEPEDLLGRCNPRGVSGLPPVESCSGRRTSASRQKRRSAGLVAVPEGKPSASDHVSPNSEPVSSLQE